MIKGDARQLHVEQFLHRELAPGIGQADDDAVNAVGADDSGNVFDDANDARIDDWCAHARRVGINEADDVDAKFVTPLEQLSRQRDRRGARPDEQQALTGTHAPAQPLEGHPPTDHEDEYQDRRDHEDAATDDEAGEPVVNGGEQKRRRGERLDDPHEQFATVGDPPEVV